MSDRLKGLKKRRTHRTIEGMAEAIGCSTHSVKDWLSGKVPISKLWWEKIEPIAILESVDASIEERERIIDLMVDAAAIAGTTAALARRLGVTIHHCAKLKLGRILPTAELLEDIERIAGNDQREDKVYYSPDKVYKQRWSQTVVGAINEYAKRYRDKHADEYKRISRMRNMDICWPGACVKCDMECTARTAKHQATQPARLKGNTGRRYQRA